MHRPGVALAAAVLTLALAPRAAPQAPRPIDGAAWRQHVEEGWSSPFGLDYVFVLGRQFRDPQIARELGGWMGVRWVNFAQVDWGAIEPRPPVRGRHAYRWQALDEGVRQWQEQGVHILLSLRFVCHWANARSTLPPTYLKGIFSWLPRTIADYRPKPEHVADLRAFIAALVERYDGDGVADMPGLLFPVLHYQVCNEAYNELYWAGTVEEYGEHLREVARAARGACPSVKIVLSGVCFLPMDGFYDRRMDPRTQAYVDRHLPRSPANMKAFLERMVAFSRRSLAFPDYDILDARWSNFGVVERCREEARRAGRPDVPIWSAEIYTVHPLLESMVLPMTTLHPYPTPSRSLEYLRITRSPTDKRYPEVVAWCRAMQAAMVVKCCMVGLHAGAKVLMNGWALDAQTSIVPYPLAMGGYKSVTTGQLWPAAHTYRLLIAKLDGFKACRRLAMPEFAYVYECTVRGGRRVLVAFCDDHIGRNHDEPGPRVTVDIPWPTGSATLTHIPAAIGQSAPRVERLAASGGRLRVTLTELPVILEAATRAPAR